MFHFNKFVSRLALIVAIVLGLAVSAQAATLPVALRGTYKLKSASLNVGGLSIRTQLANASLPIGAKGLNVITSAKVKTLIKATGVGSGVNVTITKLSATSFSFTASGKVSSGGYTVDLTSASGNATLSASGLRVKLNFVATLNGISLSGTETFLLKKG